MTAGRAVLLRPARSRARVHQSAGKRTLIVGAGEVGTLLERRLHEMPELGLIPVGFVDPDPVPPPDAARAR